jgi:hypothetical protein
LDIYKEKPKEDTDREIERGSKELETSRGATESGAGVHTGKC